METHSGCGLGHGQMQLADRSCQAQCSAHVPNGGADDTDVDIPEDAFLVKNEVAVWSRKHMTHSKGESRAAKPYRAVFAIMMLWIVQ